jgi:lysyl endopeptidase
MRHTILILILIALVFSPCLFSEIQVGEKVKQTFETPHPYQGEKGVVWQKEFYYPDAGYIAVHFSKFELAKGDYVEISSPDGRFTYTYKEKGKKVKRFNNNKKLVEKEISVFWATHIPGDRAIVKLVSKNKDNAFGFVIDEWVRGYERGHTEALLAGESTARIQAICGSDDSEWAKCYDGTSMYDKGKAVCRLLINGNTACTGWLMGSEGHVMTNEHCIENQTSADNTDFEFMAEGSTCATDCSSWLACPGTVAASAGTLVRVDYDLDYALVLLPTNVSGTYGYLQLRDTLPALDERIYIPHHPSAWGKQLTVNSDNDGPYAKIYNTDASPCHGGPGDIGYYADTAGGSSGAPVLGYADNLVVALHHCGTCPNRGVPVTAIITDLGIDLPDNAVAGGTPPAEYCTTYSKNQNYEWIAQVQIGNLNHSSTASAYSDYTNKTAAVTAGGNVSVTLTPGYAGRTYSQYWKIWIDYNNDGDFTDAGEEVFSGSGTSAVSGNFTVSSGASGEKRMRVSMRYESSPDSCGAFTYGEVEDYAINVQ